jgi:hypothetical protein
LNLKAKESVRPCRPGIAAAVQRNAALQGFAQVNRIEGGIGSGPAGNASDRIEQILGMIPGLVAAVGEIRQLLSGRQKDFYAVEEFAELVRRAPYTVRSWIRDGRVSAIRVSGTGPRGRLLIPRAEINKVIDTGLGGQVPADIGD